jgi:hypothetical protein
LGVWRQNDMWVLVPWLGTKYTIRGKVVASLKSRPWWVLWIFVYPWFVRAPKWSNYTLTNLLFGLCKFVWVIELLINLFSPHPGAPAHPSTFKVLQARERTPTLHVVVFIFGLVIMSIKELGGASHGIRALVELDPLVGEFWWHWKGLVSQYMKPWWKNAPKT